jgi:hypothetical protein
MRLWYSILVVLLLMPLVVGQSGQSNVVPARQAVVPADQDRALESGVQFLREHIKFAHRNIPISDYDMIVQDPKLSENGWELMVRVTGKLAGKEVHRDMLLYVDPVTFQVQRVFLAKASTLPADL